MALFRCV